MKIVNLQQFLALPAETLFAKYQPCVFGDWEIKVGNAGQQDFYTQAINGAIAFNDTGEFVDRLTDAEENGVSIAMDFDTSMRDGLFEDKQLFAIYERPDIEALIARLQRCLAT